MYIMHMLLVESKQNVPFCSIFGSVRFTTDILEHDICRLVIVLHMPFRLSARVFISCYVV